MLKRSSCLPLLDRARLSSAASMWQKLVSPQQLEQLLLSRREVLAKEKSMSVFLPEEKCILIFPKTNQ